MISGIVQLPVGSVQTSQEGPSAFVPLRNTYLHIHENIRGQGEARKIPSRNVFIAGLEFQVHPQQQVVKRLRR